MSSALSGFSVCLPSAVAFRQPSAWRFRSVATPIPSGPAKAVPFGAASRSLDANRSHRQRPPEGAGPVRPSTPEPKPLCGCSRRTRRSERFGCGLGLSTAPTPSVVAETTPSGLVRRRAVPAPGFPVTDSVRLRTLPSRTEAPSGLSIQGRNPFWSSEPPCGRSAASAGDTEASPTRAIPWSRLPFGAEAPPGAVPANRVLRTSSSRPEGPSEAGDRSRRFPPVRPRPPRRGPLRCPKAPLGNCKVRHDSPARQPESIPSFREARVVFARPRNGLFPDV